MLNRLFPMTIAILAVMQVVCNKQSMDPDETEPMDPVEWIQSNAVSVLSLDPSDEEFTDLAPLIHTGTADSAFIWIDLSVIVGIDDIGGIKSQFIDAP